MKKTSIRPIDFPHSRRVEMKKTTAVKSTQKVILSTVHKLTRRVSNGIEPKPWSQIRRKVTSFSR